MGVDVLVLNGEDDVGIALRDLAPGEAVSGGRDVVTVGPRPVPRGHKIALSDVGRRAPVRKYGQVIGVATADIVPGDHVHAHNLAFDDEAARALRRTGPTTSDDGGNGPDRPAASGQGGRRSAAGIATTSVTDSDDAARPTFRGYRRADGRVGTRNYLAILTSVNCSATTARMIADQFRGAALDEFPNVDGVIALTHTSGCGMVPESEGGRMLLRTLRGHAAHPNVSGLLVLGLGCEMVPGAALSARSGRSVDLGMPAIGAPGLTSGPTGEPAGADETAGPAPSSDTSRPPSSDAGADTNGTPSSGTDAVAGSVTGVDPGLLASIPADTVVRSLTIQESGGVRATVRAGVAAVREMLPRVNARQREECDVSELVLGLECGGSDGYSGVTANPALGWASDRLVALGGASVLAETPEVYGAEHLLTARATEPAVARKLLDRIDWWRDYVAAGGGTLDNNPSPGNKAGGLTTILEKSLGAVAKGGTAPLSAVYEYAEPVAPRAGLTFMDTPGYDPVSVTGMVAGGANVVVFTTGRGSVFGCRPTPSIKVATNTPMYSAMAEDMDVNAGVIVDGTASLEDVGRQIFDLVLAVASGEHTVSEDLEIGAEEFIPWHVGAVT
ncbi:UxaA family hydrolase [Myceligenerans salitolerans]|uniref:Altronate dehydratase n=1 Tax=Myceligenerans salitolerans TaxID=1230528 RepID=A0ABS3I7J6_9MICO|nr:altronate dehydratase family protein [Myceligenerans salitolerans]MBO0608981.1 altronate dehydratase [Myceligenerans salitolerans]